MCSGSSNIKSTSFLAALAVFSITWDFPFSWGLHVLPSPQQKPLLQWVWFSWSFQFFCNVCHGGARIQPDFAFAQRDPIFLVDHFFCWRLLLRRFLLSCMRAWIKVNVKICFGWLVIQFFVLLKWCIQLLFAFNGCFFFVTPPLLEKACNADGVPF